MMKLAEKRDGTPALVEVTTKVSSETPDLNVRLHLPVGTVLKVSDGAIIQTTEFGKRQAVEQFKIGLN